MQEGQRGFRVAPVTRGELVDLIASRVRLECMALADSCERGESEWEASILAARHRLNRHPRSQEKLLDEVWEQLHRRFHLALIEACGSPILLSYCADLHDRFDRYRRLGVAMGGKHPVLRPLQEELVELTLARDATEACRVLKEHIEDSGRAVTTMLDQVTFELPAATFERLPE